MKALLALLAMALTLAPAGAKSQELRVLTEEFRPFQYQDEAGKPTGFMVELVESLFETAGIGIEGGEIEINPWARTYDTLQKTANAVAFMTVRNAERENLFKWVGPLAPREMWLYKLKARDDIKVETLEDAKAYHIGGYRSAQTDYLIELGFANVDIAPHERLNVQRLLRGRVDMVPSLELMMAERLRDLGASQDTVAKVIVFDNRFDYYLAVNPNVPDDVIARLQEALDYAKASGTYGSIRAKYIN